MRGSGREGTQFPKITALPFWTRTPSRPERSPKCLAFLLAGVTRQGGPLFLTSLSATSCHQPPNDSIAMGRKAIPCLMQASPAPRTLFP